MSTNIYEEKRRALSIRETARTCGLSRATLYRLLKPDLNSKRASAAASP